MKLRFIIVGRDRGDPLIEASNDYLARIKRYVPAEIVELKEEPLRKNGPVERIKRAEADRIEKALSSHERSIMMDERGRQMTSTEWAERVQSWMTEGQSVAFVIGGPSGLHPDLLKAGKERWALSRLTLPHRMARLMLLEQVYRAFTIVRGEPYHK